MSDSLTVKLSNKHVCLKCTKIRLAAGLRADPLGELKRSPGPLAAIKGSYF